MQGLSAGIDKIEVHVPKEVPFRPEIAELYQEARAGHLKGFGPGNLYTVQGDLRPYGMDAILYVGKKFDKEGGGKLELLQTGEKSWAENMSIVESVVDHDPLELRTMRTDLTVDVENVPVSWVLENGRIDYKRFHRQVRTQPECSENFSSPTDCMGSGEIQTIYGGKRPNLFRVYNKTAERLNEYRKVTRGWDKKFPTLKDWLKFNQECGWSQKFASYEEWLQSNDEPEAESRFQFELIEEYYRAKKAFEVARAQTQLPKPTFEQVYGYQQNRVLTRFERQMSAKEVATLHTRPNGQDLSTLGKVRANVIEFNPFTPLRFLRPGLPSPNPANYSPLVWHAGMNFRRMVELQGYANAVAFTRKFANGHMASFLKSIQDFLPASESDDTGVTPARLYEMYRSTLERQFAA